MGKKTKHTSKDDKNHKSTAKSNRASLSADSSDKAHLYPSMSSVLKTLDSLLQTTNESMILNSVKLTKVSDEEFEQVYLSCSKLTDLLIAERERRSAKLKKVWPPPLPEIEDKELEKLVFTHPSYIKDSIELSQEDKIKRSNDRLEFLGDAVIYELVTCVLYKFFPTFAAGQLTDLRIDFTKNNTFSIWANMYGLEKKLNFKSNINYHKEHKIWADVFEAYIGALYLESLDSLSKRYELESWLRALLNPLVESLNPSKTNAELASAGTTTVKRKASHGSPEGEKGDTINLSKKSKMEGLGDSSTGEGDVGSSRSAIIKQPTNSKEKSRKQNAKDKLFGQIGGGDISPSYEETTKGGKISCQIFMGTMAIGSGMADNAKDARTKAAEDALSKPDVIAYWANKRKKKRVSA